MSSSTAVKGPLTGRTVALPETRELERMVALLTKEGATTLSCPLIGIQDVAETSTVEAWLRKLSAGAFQDLIFTTGEGVSRLLAFAERFGVHEQVVAAARLARIVTRGPKPARALRQVGLAPGLPAVQPTTDGIIETLADQPMAGRTVGLQLYGQDPNEKLVGFLEGVGATVSCVAPYVYLPATEDPEVEDLIRRMAEGSIDVIAFTTRKQIDRLFEVATARGLTDVLLEGFRRTRVAAVGPVVVATLQERCLRVDAVPERSFFLRPLVEQVVSLLLEPNTLSA